MAARETGFGAVENFLHQGKLLALELLVRVLENPLHAWSNVRPEVRLVSGLILPLGTARDMPSGPHTDLLVEDS